MINISTTFSFSIIYTSIFLISLTNQYSFILHFRNFEYSLQTLRQPPCPCFMQSLQRRKEKDKKKEGKKRRRKRKRTISKVKRRKNMGKLSLPVSTHQIPFYSYHVYIHFTTPHHLYQFYLSFSTIIIHIIWENN